MRKLFTFIGISLLIFSGLPVVAWGQFQEYQLPNAAPVTGMSFPRNGYGLITTADSLVYRVEWTGKRTVQFTPANLYLDVEYDHVPTTFGSFWMKDTIVYAWRRHFYENYTRYLMQSTDGGQTWSAVLAVYSLDLITDRDVLGDSLFYLIFAYDVAGHISLGRYGALADHRGGAGMQYDSGDRSRFTGEGVPVTPDTVLLSTRGDSLFYYAFDTDTLWGFVPLIPVDSQRAEFRSLIQHPSGAILGFQQVGMFHSIDQGRSWSVVWPDRRIGQLSRQPDGTWYGLTGDSLWVSHTAGRTWQLTEFRLPPGYSRFEIVANEWLWLGSDSGKVALSRWPVTSITQPGSPAPQTTRLLPAYPNPFNAQTMIPYTIAEQGYVRLEVYSLRGRKVAILVDRVQTPGGYTVTFQARDIPTGIYFVRLQTVGQQRVRKMVLIK